LSEEIQLYLLFNFSTARNPLVDQGLPSVEALRSHSVRHTTIGRTPLDEWSDRRLRRDSNPQTQQAIGRRPTP